MLLFHHQLVHHLLSFYNSFVMAQVGMNKMVRRMKLHANVQFNFYAENTFITGKVDCVEWGM